jgi:hypothetical protein
LTGDHMAENDERSFDAILGALREAVKEDSRLREMPAEEVARQLVLEGRLEEEPDPSVVAETLESLEAEEQSFQNDEISPEEDQPNLQTCDACRRQTEIRYYRRGDAICGRCKAVFAVAKVLYRSGAKDEAQIIATMAYAARHGENTLKHHESVADRYTRFDHIKTLKGVPFLRPKPAIAQVVRYQGHNLPKLVRLEILLKFAVPAEIAGLDHKTLQRESLPVFTTSPGSFPCDKLPTLRFRALLTEGGTEQLESARA